MKIKRIKWLKETENEKMETEQKGRLTGKPYTGGKNGNGNENRKGV